MVRGIRDIFLIGKDKYINLTPDSPNKPQVVITTGQHCEGYNLTFASVMITGVYFSNNSTREQLERRINRINQTAPVIQIITIHAGIISYVFERYEKVRNLSKTLSSFASSIGVEELSINDI